VKIFIIRLIIIINVLPVFGEIKRGNSLADAILAAHD